MQSTDPDWFARNADPRNPLAHINTNPAYFGSECAAAIVNGTLAPTYRAPDGKVPPANFCATVQANVDNEGLSDADFRQFVRNSLSVVDMPSPTPQA